MKKHFLILAVLACLFVSCKKDKVVKLPNFLTATINGTPMTFKGDIQYTPATGSLTIDAGYNSPQGIYYQLDITASNVTGPGTYPLKYYAATFREYENAGGIPILTEYCTQDSLATGTLTITECNVSPSRYLSGTFHFKANYTVILIPAPQVLLVTDGQFTRWNW